MGCVRPEERAYFTGYLHCPVDGQLLQRLYVENSVVELAFRAFVPVDTLPLTKHLPHTNALLPSRRIAKK
jgi:hypothetical protein